MSKKLYIAFEGLDCSGKSTLAKALVKKMNVNDNLPFGYYFKALKENPTQDDDLSLLIRNRMNENDTPTDSMPLLAVINDMEQDYLRHQVLEFKHLIQDRSFLSSIVYGDCKSTCSHALSSIIDMTLLPDLFIFVDPPLEVIMKRIQEESLFDTYTPKNLEDIKKQRDLFIKALDKYGNVCIVSGMDIDKDIDKINEYIKDRFDIRLTKSNSWLEKKIDKLKNINISDYLNHWTHE